MFEYETDEASGIFSLFNAKPRHDINIEIKLFVPSKLNTVSVLKGK